MCSSMRGLQLVFCDNKYITLIPWFLYITDRYIFKPHNPRRLKVPCISSPADTVCTVGLMLGYWLWWFPVLLILRRRWQWGWPLVAGDGGSRYRQQGRAELVDSLTGAEEHRGDGLVCVISTINFKTIWLYIVAYIIWNTAHLAGQLLLKSGSYKRPGTHVLRLLLTPYKLCGGIFRNELHQK